MTTDVLVAEIGSTTTLVNAFDGIGTASLRFVGQGSAPTSVLAGVLASTSSAWSISVSLAVETAIRLAVTS